MSSLPASTNSTNVRNAIYLATVAWAIVVAFADLDGAFARFDTSEIAAFVALVSLYAAATFFMDAELREYASHRGPAAVRTVAVAAVGLLGIALARECAPLAAFVAPLATLALVAALATPRSAAKSASSAKSPGATRAAT